MPRKKPDPFRTVEGRIERYLDSAEDWEFWKPGVYLERLSDTSENTRTLAHRMVEGWIRWLSSLNRALLRGRMNQEQEARFRKIATRAGPYLKRAAAAGFMVRDDLFQILFA